MRRAERNVLIYCRQSRDDARANYARIEEQARILTEFCNERGLGRIIDTVLDDNKSGTDFARLANIKDMIRRGEVDVFLCKDSSRLGRLQRESLAFADFLHEYGVELVMEAEEYEEDFFGLRAWLNERRAREDGIKSRNALRKRMEAGSMVIKAPYGYVKTGKNGLEIDPPAADIVREIFRRFVSGSGKREIADILNSRNIPTPAQHKAQYIGRNYAPRWNKQHIQRVLTHVIYTGDMPYGMREKVSYKVKRFRTKQREDWIIIPGHHEPIISAETFSQAQQRSGRNGGYPARNPATNVFSGLVVCGRCASRMYRKTRANCPPWYICSRNNNHGGVKDRTDGPGCNPHRVTEWALLEHIRGYAAELLRTPAAFRIISAYSANGTLDGEQALQSKISLLQRQAQTAERKLSQIYDDKLDGIISQELYLRKQRELTELIAEAEQAADEHRARIEQLNDRDGEETAHSRIASRILRTGIHHRTIALLFKRIIVFDPGDAGAEQTDGYGLTNSERRHLRDSGGILFVKS
ncbi:MAG: recombinase family protein [Defluviitaleaceae bacterium]|nr:recombinase family protein [Defluviitaleaceae bacterium]